MRHGGVGIPVVTVARLLKQLDAGRIKRPRELLALLARIGAVGIEPQRGAAGDRALDDRNALEVRFDVLADLDLECAKSHRQPVFNLLPNSVGIERVDRRQQP